MTNRWRKPAATKAVLLVGWALVIPGVPALFAATPNIVVIMADDVGAGELACYGNPDTQTPHLDRLADEGVRVSTCYATPNCSSTRMMLMTGRYGFRTGWYNFLEREYSPEPGSPKFDIGRAEITFADVLKERGYATGIAGKWQLPGSPRDRIYDCGFDTYCMWMWKHQLPDIDPQTGRDRTPYDPHASLHDPPKANRYWDPAIMVDARRRSTGPDDFGPDICTDFVCDYMREHQSEPFLIYYPMILCHKHSKTWTSVPDLARPGERTEAGVLKFDVEYMDHLVGRICQTIDELGLRDNTYVFFTCDNGTEGDGKGEVTEMGARVPMLVRGPGIRPHRVSDELVDLSDVLPTLAELAGATLPTDREIDGVSMAPMLFDRPGPRREWIFSYLGNQRMLRDKRWLLEGDGRFYDCGDSRDGSGYVDVTDSRDATVVAAHRRFDRILLGLPRPGDAGSS
jgi:arylsulfatase A